MQLELSIMLLSSVEFIFHSLLLLFKTLRKNIDPYGGTTLAHRLFLNKKGAPRATN